MLNSLQCLDCKHLDREAPRGTFRCAAFPRAIPDPILTARHDHTRPFRGDHGIRFEPVAAPEPSPPAA